MSILPFLLFVVGPALCAMAALVGGITLLQRPPDGARRSGARVVAGVVALLVALGIGACFAVVWTGRF